MESTTETTRERIVSAAAKLFYGEGIRAVSVDAVAEKAGVTKRTLYYHFDSKDDLIAAYLEGRDQPNLACSSDGMPKPRAVWMRRSRRSSIGWRRRRAIRNGRAAASCAPRPNSPTCPATRH
jgi:AcrR family transcriptional regulator